MYRFALLLTLLPLPATADGTFHLRIGTSSSSQMTQKTAQDIIAEIVTNLGKSCDPPTITLGGVGVYAKTDLSVFKAKNYSETKLYRESGYSVHIVDDIIRCGKLDLTTLAGCAYVGGPVIVKRQGSVGSYALLMAHEMAHAQGLAWSSTEHPDYKDGHNTRFARLMNGSPWAWKLDGQECTKLLGPQAFAAGGPGDGDDQDPAPAPREYLMAPWVHGPDLEVIATMPEALAATAIAALRENDFALWPNAVTLLGVIQPPEAADLLVKAVRHPGAGLTSEQGFYVNDARNNALVALGYLVHTGRFNDIDEVGFLRDHLDPASNAREIDFGDVSASERNSRAESLALRATMALALSQTDMARAALMNQRAALRGGDIVLPVDETFFDELDNLAQSVRDLPLQQMLISPDRR